MKIRGEYWIDGDGTVEACDGDQGVDVPNHEMLATQEVERRLCDALEIDYYEPENSPEVESFEEHALAELTEVWGLTPPAVDAPEGATAEEARDAVEEKELAAFLHAPSLADGLKKHRPDLLPLFDALQTPVPYCMEELGWARVHGNNVQTARFDPEARQRIAEGMRQILYDEGMEYELPDGADLETACGEFELRIYGLKDRADLWLTIAEVEAAETATLAVPTVDPAQAQLIADDKVAELDAAITPSYYAERERAQRSRERQSVATYELNRRGIVDDYSPTPSPSADRGQSGPDAAGTGAATVEGVWMTSEQLRVLFPTDTRSCAEETGVLRQTAGVRAGTDGFWVVIPPWDAEGTPEPERDAITEGPWETPEEAQGFIDAEVGATTVRIVELRGGVPVNNPFAKPLDVVFHSPVGPGADAPVENEEEPEDAMSMGM